MTKKDKVREQLIDCACECAELTKYLIYASYIIENDFDFSSRSFSALGKCVERIQLLYDDAMTLMEAARKQEAKND